MLLSHDEYRYYDSLAQTLKEQFESIIYSQKNITPHQKNIINYYVAMAVGKGVGYVRDEIRFLDMGD